MAKSFGFDINNPGASVFARGAVEVPQAYFTAIVEDIIINETSGRYLKYDKVTGNNIGEAKVRIIPNDANLALQDLKSAYPLDMNIQEFPFIGEQVIVFVAGNTYFYTRKLSLKRKITENISSVMYDQMTSPDTSLLNDIRELSRRGVPTNNTRTVNETNTTIALNINTRPVRSSPGDLIIQGRFGNAIRVGSSLFANERSTPEPNILLTAGFWKTPTQISTQQITPYSLQYEDINNDFSSIWMVSNQTVDFKAATVSSKSTKKAHMVSSIVNPGGPQEYDGAQIFINSDRVILNTKLNEISLFSNSEINLSSIKSITLDTESSILASSNNNVSIKAGGDISLQGKNITLTSTQDLSYKTDGNYTIMGKMIFIGKYADKQHPMVSGAELSLWLQKLMDAFIFKLPASIASLNPQPFVDEMTNLRKDLSTPLTPQLATFNSRNNFTSITNQ